MDKFSVWLSGERILRHISCKELQALYNELNMRVVSIRGNGVFSLTYAVVATVRLF